MNKSEFIKQVSAKANTTEKATTDIYNAMVSLITMSLKISDTVALTGFGNFEVKCRAAREGINPATKQKIKIKSAIVPTFKFSKTYKSQFAN